MRTVLELPDRVLGFLAANEDRAFETREIASQIGVDEAVAALVEELR